MTVRKVCVPCPKPSLVTFIGSWALTWDFKELWVVCGTDKMPVPRGSCSQSLQKQSHGFRRENGSSSWCLRKGGEKEVPPSCPLSFEAVPVSLLRESEEIHQAKVVLSTAPRIPRPDKFHSPARDHPMPLHIWTEALQVHGWETAGTLSRRE